MLESDRRQLAREARNNSTTEVPVATVLDQLRSAREMGTPCTVIGAFGGEIRGVVHEVSTAYVSIRTEKASVTIPTAFVREVLNPS